VATVQAIDEPDSEPVNEVRVRGRWVGAQERQLPSGDSVVVARVIVPRSTGGVDTLDCAVWAPPALRRRALRMSDDSVVEVTGSLRRRFWRTPGGPASRYEVEVSSIRRLRGSGSPAR
jgi:single-strand DNA-binding protein